MWDTSLPDWKDRILSGSSLVPSLPLFTEEAAWARRVFNRLRIPDIPGQPTMEEACGPWFFPIVDVIFGSLDVENNVRMIQEFFLLIPKKNSKSTGASSIMLTAMIVNRRPNAEMAVIAPTKDIADTSFKQAERMIKLDAELSKIFHCQQHIRRITNRKNDAVWQIKAADTDTITGSLNQVTLIDETHVFAKNSKASHVFLELRGALTARPDGFLMQITTQSKEEPTGVFKEELAMARAVRDGKMKQPLLPILYELPPDLAKDGGWKERRYWAVVNPNLGRSVNEAFLERELRKAEEKGMAALALFASQHFNVEIGIGLQTNSWPGAEFWLEHADPDLTLEDIKARCDVVVVGIDGGGLDDLLGLAVIGRERDTRKWLHWAHAWCHPKVLERRKEVAPKLLDLQRDGNLTIIQESGQDVSEVADIVVDLDDAGLLPEKGAIGVDEAGISDIVDELELRGIDTSIDGARVIGVSQGWRLSNVINVTARRVAAGELVHGGQPLMAWCIGNAKVEPRGNAITITKQTAGSAKIDPLMATFNAVACMIKNPETNVSVYENQGIRWA